MRICFTSDLHGYPNLYAQLAELIQAEPPDLLILGGDLFVDGDLDDPVATQVGYVDGFFMEWVRRQRAALPGLSVACILGNHDWLCTQEALQEHDRRGDIALLNEHRVWKHRGVGFVGYSCTPPTPFWVKDFERLDRSADAVPNMGGAIWNRERRKVQNADAWAYFRENATIEEDLSAAAAAPGPWILAAHAPPYDSKLDSLPHLAGPIGSRAIRAFIESRQPLVSLHGHIHESPDVTGSYAVDLGQTLSINPGQSQARLHAVLFDSDRPRETLRHTVRK